MFEVKGRATVASVTDLRRAAAELLERAERGEPVILQRNNDAVGVILGFEAYSRLVEAVERLEDAELLATAAERRRSVESGEEKTHSLAEVRAELERIRGQSGKPKARTSRGRSAV